MSEDSEFYDQIHKHLAENPEAAFLDRLTGVVMDALEKLEMRVGTLTPEQRKFAFHMLAVQAIGNVTYRMTERPLDPVRIEREACSETDPDEMCTDCLEGWERAGQPTVIQVVEEIAEAAYAEADTECPIGCTCIYCVPGA